MALIACVAGCGPATSTLDSGSPGDSQGALDAAVMVDLWQGDLAETVAVQQMTGVVVSTLAGSAIPGSQDGTGAAAQFDNPTGVTLDGAGNLYVAEYDGSRMRKVTPAGESALLTSQADFVGPFGVMLATATQLLVQTDFDATGIKSPTSGTLWTIPLSTGTPKVVVTGLGRPRGLAALAAGRIVVVDHVLHLVSVLDSSNWQMIPLAGSSGNAGLVDGQGVGALFNNPLGVAVMPDASVIVADSDNHCLRRVLGDGTVTTFAGNGTRGVVDGPAAIARFDRPIAVAIDDAGDVFVSDQGDSHRIRRVTPAGVVETIAGNGVGGFADGDGAAAEFYGQEGIAVRPDGKRVYVADGNAGDGMPFHRLRAIALP